MKAASYAGAMALVLGIGLTSAVCAAADNSLWRRLNQDHKVGKDAQASARTKPEGYELLRIPIPPQYSGGLAQDINNKRTVAGVLFYPFGAYDTFLWEAGGPVKIIKYVDEFGVEAPITSVPTISDSGVLFGNWGSFTEQTAAYYHLASKRWTNLPAFPGKNLNIGYRANNAGRATGQACNGDWFAPTDCVLWIWDGKQYQTPTLPPALSVFLDGINEIGQVVGYYVTQPTIEPRAFLLEGNTSTDLLPGVLSLAYDINNSQEAVLSFLPSPGAFLEPALVKKGQVTLLPLLPGALGTTYLALNDRGDFSGYAFDQTTQSFFFVYPVVAFKN